MKTLISFLVLLIVEAFTPTSSIGRTLFEIIIGLWAFGVDIMDFSRNEKLKQLRELNKLMFERQETEETETEETKPE